MKKKSEGRVKLCRSGRCTFLCIERDRFSEGKNDLIVEDRVNLLLPWMSQRVLKISGTNALYSAVPLGKASHRLLCYTYCADALKQYPPDFYRHALILGCGGGALPRWLLEEYPRLKVDVVERSPEIIAVSKKYFLHRWEHSDRLKLFCTDAREYDSPAYLYEFIFCDLFDGKYLAPLVYDRSFAAKLGSMTGKEGFLMINCGWFHLSEAIGRIYQEVFEEVQVVDRKPGQTEVIRAGNAVK